MQTNENTKKRILGLLGNWVRRMTPELHWQADAPELCYYGDGSNGWGVQTNQKAFAAFAVYGAQTGDADALRCALGMLRYSLRTHHTGDYPLTSPDVPRWGRTWISILGLERMMCGIEAIDACLIADDRARLQKLLRDEADHQLTVPVIAGFDRVSNKPESNWWNGALLLRVALCDPDAPHAAQYREKAADFLANAISVPSDAQSGDDVDGKPGSERFVGANFTESYGLNHHGYLNIGYMVITLSQLAMLHFSLKRRRVAPPEYIYRHSIALWQLVKSLIFPDGRLCRIGGDTRVRYCYCQDYLLPVLGWAADYLGEDVSGWMAGWCALLEQECRYNGDGSFLKKRVELFREHSPLYYTRLESDRAVSLAFVLQYGCKPADRIPPVPLADWHDDAFGACFTRNDRRMAAFTWCGGEGPTGLCVPVADSSMAEWQANLNSTAAGDGAFRNPMAETYKIHAFPGGFITAGWYHIHEELLLTEQADCEDIMRVQLVFAALPDGATVVTMQRGTACKNMHTRAVWPLRLLIPNDVFNQFRRDYDWAPDRCAVSIDGKLTLQSLDGQPFTLHRPPYRQIGLHISAKFAPYQERGMLHCDEWVIAPKTEPQFYEKDTELFTIGAMLTVGGAQPVPEAMHTVPGTTLWSVVVRGQDGLDYRIVWNPASEAQTFSNMEIPGADGVCIRI